MRCVLVAEPAACRVRAEGSGRRATKTQAETLTGLTTGHALDALTKHCSDVLLMSADGESLFIGQRKVQPQPDWWFIGGRRCRHRRHPSHPTLTHWCSSKTGDTPQAAAARNVKRELRLDIDPDRFKVVSNLSFVWNYREQVVSTALSSAASCVCVPRWPLTAPATARRARCARCPRCPPLSPAVPAAPLSAQEPKANGTADLSTVHVLPLTEEETAGISAADLDEKECVANTPSRRSSRRHLREPSRGGADCRGLAPDLRYSIV